MNEKKFGIVVCPSCQNAKAADLNNKTSECSHCGERLILKKLKVYYEADSQEEVSWAVGQLNAKIRGKKLPDMEKNVEIDPYSKALKERKTGSNEREKLLAMSRTLTRELGSFDRDDLEMLSVLGGLGNVDDIIGNLRKLDEVYEPDYEVFKTV